MAIQSLSDFRPSSGRTNRSIALSRWFAAIGILGGGVVLAVWVLDLPLVKGPLPGLATMKANTAATLVLAGLSLRLLTGGPGCTRAAQALGLLVFLIGTLTLSQDVLGWGLGFDQLLFRDWSAGPYAPGRMAPTTAFAFLAFGASVLVSTQGRHPYTAHLIALVVTLVTWIALLGYLFDVSTLSSVAMYSTMAVHTALLLFVMSIGLLCATPGGGLTAVILNDEYGGAMARRLVPPALVAPVVIGWFRLQGEQAGFYGTEFGVALMVTATILTLSVVILWNARSLIGMEADRQQAHDELLVQKDHVRSILDSALDAVISIDAIGTVTYWNQRAEGIFGWPADEALGRNLAELVMPERYRDRHRRGLERFLATREGPILGRRVEITGLRRNGTEFPIELAVTALKKDGSYFFNAFIADITERKGAEASLAIRERQQASLLRLARQLERTHTFRQVLQSALDEVQTVLGYRNVWALLLSPAGDEASLVTIEGSMSDTVRESFAVLKVTGDAMLEEIFAGQGPVVVEDARTDPRTDKDIVASLGNRTIINVPLLLADQKIGALGTGSFGDEGVKLVDGQQLEYLEAMASQVAGAFDRIRLMAERTLAADRFRLVFESAPNAMVMVDRHGTIALVNAQTERLFGYDRSDLIGHSIDRLVPDRHRDQHRYQRERFMDAPEARAMGQGRDLFARRKDGSEFPVEIGLNPIETPEGLMVLSAILDLTERKQADQHIRTLNLELEERVAERTLQLEAANKELEAFSYSVSHDLRAPLRQIDGFSKILLDEHLAGMEPSARRYLTIIRDGTRKMAEMIDDLLKLSRIERQKLDWKQVNLNELVKDVVAELEPETRGRSINWQLGTLPTVRCDRGLIRLVFVNLLSNAVKFTRRSDRADIHISCHDGSGVPVIVVRDNGAGFDQRFANQLFGAFQRLHRMEEYEGTGIGLATVQRILKRHGGRIWAEAEVDRGAAFYFTLGTPPTQVMAGTWTAGEGSHHES